MTTAEIPAASGPVATMPTLARCIGDTTAFADNWGRAPRLVRRTERPDHSTFHDVLTLAQLDEYVSMSARTPAVRMVIGGDVVPPGRYCTPVRVGGVHLDDVVDARKVTTLLADGATLVVQSLHRTVPSVARFVGALQRELGHPVQANAYLTPPSASGLTAHADRHDVIALQLDGRKAWWVDGLGDVELHPGDSLSIPVGTRHRASTSDDTSLHLTIGIIRVSPRQVIERVLRRAVSDLDRPLPVGYRHPARRDALASCIDEALEAALDAIGSADLDGVVDAEQHRRLEPPPRPGRIASVADAERIAPDTVIEWIAADPLVRDDPHEESRISIDLGDRTLTLPRSTMPALTALTRGVPVVVDDLPGLDQSSRLVLARRLVREAACIVVGFADLPDGEP
jgi:mannose-6-phosphate isomerase-like protein (cupin superfamily)